MERQDFFSQDDSEWLDDLMKKSGFEETPAQEENYGVDFSQISEEEKGSIEVAGFFISREYNNFFRDDINIESEALRMLRSLASFVENAALKDGEKLVRIGERYPNVNVRHVRTMAWLNKKMTGEVLLRNQEGTDIHNHFKKFETHFSNLIKISNKAIEFEDKRKMRDQQKS